MKQMKTFKRVACGISGGVDSSVAALLLSRKGFDVVGVFMHNWDHNEEDGRCVADKEFEDGSDICKKLRIPLLEVNFVKEYWNNVFSKLLGEYSSGLTPNPDVLCNRHIKFDAFYSHCINRLGVDAIATGHYARTTFGPYLEHYMDTNVKLLQARDTFHDQTFFLSRVPQLALRHCMFPLGEYTKEDVRQIATEAGLVSVAHKKASAGICFIGKRNFQAFIQEYLNDRPGNFVDVDNGQVVGRHRGIHQWTIGQRCRIQCKHKPYFVAKKDFKTGDIYVAQGHDHPILHSTTFHTDLPYWIDGSPLIQSDTEMFECKFRFQHTYPLVKCCIRMYANEDHMSVTLLEGSLRALSPGQFAVFYKDKACLGSARIISVEYDSLLYQRFLNT